MKRIDRLRSCIGQVDDVLLLRSTVAEMFSSGDDKVSILADLEKLRSELRDTDNEVGEDSVLDIMDMVVGWCNPKFRLP